MCDAGEKDFRDATKKPELAAPTYFSTDRSTIPDGGCDPFLREV
jgi:hypothetical protein